MLRQDAKTGCRGVVLKGGAEPRTPIGLGPALCVLFAWTDTASIICDTCIRLLRETTNPLGHMSVPHYAFNSQHMSSVVTASQKSVSITCGTHVQLLRETTHAQRRAALLLRLRTEAYRFAMLCDNLAMVSEMVHLGAGGRGQS